MKPTSFFKAETPSLFRRTAILSPVSQRVRSALGLRTASFAAVSIAGCAAYGLAVSAAEYSIEPSFSSQIVMNDNLLLSSEGREIETFLLKLAPRIKARRATEKWQADLNLGLTFERLEDDGFDTDNQDISLQLTRRAETMMFQIIALNARESTRNVELDELGEIGFETERRDRQYVRPSVTWTMNQTNRLVVGVSGENLHYGGLDFSDYDYYGADIGWTHQFDEKTQFELSTFASDYASVPPLAGVDSFFDCVFGRDSIDSFDSETVGVQVGGSRQPTSRLSYRGSIGYRDVKNTNERQCTEIDGSLRIIENTGSSEGFILDSGVTYQGEKYGIDVSLSRSTTPVGLGFLTERDSLKVNLNYRYSESITGSLLLDGYTSESLDDTFLFEREGFRVAPRVNWRLNEKLSVNGGLVFRSNESLTSPGERKGFSMYLGFNYNLKPTRFTR